MPSIDAVKESYAKNPNKWNVGTMLALGGVAYTVLIFIVTNEIQTHSVAPNPHPANLQLIQANAQQLDRIEANQIAEQIDKMFQRTCAEPQNSYYAAELRKLITEWEDMTGKKYPVQLLKC